MSDHDDDSEYGCEDDYGDGVDMPRRLPVVTSRSGKRPRENPDAVFNSFMADADSTIDTFVGSPTTEATVNCMKKAFKASSARYSRKLKNAGVVSESLQQEYKTVCRLKDELQHSLNKEKEATTALKLDLMTRVNEVKVLEVRLSSVRSLVDIK
jgi:hypothetical protein